MPVSRATIFSSLALLLIVIVIPLALFTYDARRTGQPLGDYLSNLFSTDEGVESPVEPERTESIPFLEPTPIGDPVGDDPPWISHLAVIDVDADGLDDVVVCDAKQERVSWIRQAPAGTFQESPLGTTIRAPAHVAPSDIDGDGDLDLLVASMGLLFPSNDPIGSVVVLENDGQERFTNRVLVEGIARVTDVRGGDLDGDGDVDLAVGQFGYDDGEIRWMENDGDWQFTSHRLLSLSGTIHTPIADMDGDGDLDIVAIVSQEWEELYVFENDGAGEFETHRVFGSTNEDFGSSGISVADLDRDGDLDVLYTNGDAFDYIPPGPRPWHGVQWLENRGGLEFEYHRIGDFPGAFSANAVDVDKDGDMDVVLVSAFNDWSDPNAASMAWFENDGAMAFTGHTLTSTPTHLLALDHGDLDGDGWTDFVSGGMYVYPPYDRMGRIMLWHNRWPEVTATR